MPVGAVDFSRSALFLTAAGLLLALSAWSQPYGMGPGMMRGYWGLDLSAEQRKKIEQIQDETAKARWQLMGTIHQKGFHMDGMFGRVEFDEQEARKAFQAMADAHKEMFELSLEARKRIDAVLTKEQREKLRR